MSAHARTRAPISRHGVAAHSTDQPGHGEKALAQSSQPGPIERSSMSNDIPDWVRSDCRLWGRQKRRVWEGRDWHGNIDGYAQSLLGRIREERDGASQCTPAQRWPEVFWGAGLDVQRALLGMSEQQHAALHFQYVWNPEWGVTVDRKARYMGISRAQYTIEIGKAETWIHARLDPRPALASQLVEKVNEIVAGVLQKAKRQATKAHSGEISLAKHPDLNFSALNRPKISLRR